MKGPKGAESLHQLVPLWEAKSPEPTQLVFTPSNLIIFSRYYALVGLRAPFGKYLVVTMRVADNDNEEAAVDGSSKSDTSNSESDRRSTTGTSLGNSPVDCNSWDDCRW